MSDEQTNVPPAEPGRPDPSAMLQGGRGSPGRARVPAGGSQPPRPGMVPAGGPGRPGALPPGGPRSAGSDDGGFGRFAVDYLVPIAVGVVLAAGVYALLLKAFPTVGTLGEIRAKFVDRGFIPYVCTVLLFWHVSHLAIRYFVRIRPEFAALGENLVPAVPELALREVMEISKRAAASEAQSGSRMLTRRLLLAVDHLRISLVNVELGDLLRHAANADRARIESKRSLPNFLFWAIPVMGFAGTVGGIGVALGGAPAEGAVLSAKAPSLGAAFDTLLVAVFMTLVAFLVQSLVRHSESHLLAEVEDYLTLNLQARIRTESIDSRMQDIVGEAIEKLTYLQEEVQKNQGEIMTGNMETVTGAQTSIKAAIDTMPQVLGTAGKEAADVLAGTVKEQTQVAQSILTNLDAKATDIAHNLGAEFNKVTAELSDALKDITGRLADSFQSAKQLTEIQAALQKNLEELNKIHDLGQSFSEMKETLAALKPVLASLNKPIPLKFTLEEAELGIGGAPGGDMVVR